MCMTYCKPGPIIQRLSVSCWSSLGSYSSSRPAGVWPTVPSGCAWTGLADFTAGKHNQWDQNCVLFLACAQQTTTRILRLTTRQRFIDQPTFIMSSQGGRLRQAHLHRLVKVIKQGFISNRLQLMHQCPLTVTPADTTVKLCQGHLLEDNLCLLRAQVSPPGPRNQQGTRAMRQLQAALLSSVRRHVPASLMTRTNGLPLHPVSSQAQLPTGEPVIQAGAVMETGIQFFDYYGPSVDIFCFHSIPQNSVSYLCTTHARMATLQMIIMFKGTDASYDFWLSIPHHCHEPCVKIVACVLGRHIDEHFKRQKVSFPQKWWRIIKKSYSSMNATKKSVRKSVQEERKSKNESQRMKVIYIKLF